jgi:Holliday junction resolvase RusA-like endonuclease
MPTRTRTPKPPRLPAPSEKDVRVGGSYRLVIPGWHPATLNQWDGRHWSMRARLKTFDRNMVATYALKAGLPRATHKRRVTVTITLAKGERACDPDAHLKSLGDALVHCGLLRDDSRQWVEWAATRYERGAERATTIELEDLP